MNFLQKLARAFTHYTDPNIESVPAHVQEQRLEQCWNCPHLDEEKATGTVVCGVCGCPVLEKADDPREFCSDPQQPKWGAYNG